MKRKTTCLALAAKCCGLGARGLALGSAARAAKKPSRVSRSMRARPAKPPPTSHRNSRRERPHGVGLAMKRPTVRPPPRGSIGVDELVEIEQHAAQLTPGRRLG